jgi:DNA-binding GntR family transcriptional regulator
MRGEIATAPGLARGRVDVKLSQIAYQRFKEALFTGQIKSGSVLSQSELVDALGVPVSPLREAMQVLEAEGLLTVMPRSGIRIVQPDMELIKNAYQLRRLLEREAVLKFAISSGRDELEAWADRHVDLAKEIEAGLDQPELAERHAKVDAGFHYAMVGTLRNPIIEEVYDRTMERLLLIRLDRPAELTPLLVKVTMAEHLKIITAMQRQDPDAAAAAMDEHLMLSMHRAMGV